MTLIKLMNADSFSVDECDVGRLTNIFFLCILMGTLMTLIKRINAPACRQRQGFFFGG